MKETGIIMTGDHPKLILDNSKTMTRRTRGLKEINENPDGYDYPMVYKGVSGDWWVWFHQKDSDTPMIIKCPYGGVDDRLWVRETWWRDQSGGCWGYKAEDREWPPTNCGGKAMSSMFMPRWASRLTLEIMVLRVERLQEITEEDAEAEGESWSGAGDGENYDVYSAVENYAHLWDSLNAKRGYGWDKNPWVWVISFRRLTLGDDR